MTQTLHVWSKAVGSILCQVFRPVAHVTGRDIRVSISIIPATKKFMEVRKNKNPSHCYFSTDLYVVQALKANRVSVVKSVVPYLSVRMQVRSTGPIAKLYLMIYYGSLCLPLEHEAALTQHFSRFHCNNYDNILLGCDDTRSCSY